jgi:hypothetical protein
MVIGIQHVCLRFEEVHTLLVIIQSQGSTVALPPVMDRLRSFQECFWIIINQGQSGDDQNKDEQLPGIPAYFFHLDMGWAYASTSVPDFLSERMISLSNTFLNSRTLPVQFIF